MTTVTLPREVVQQAIEIIEQLIACHEEPTCPAIVIANEASIVALRAALDAKPSCELYRLSPSGETVEQKARDLLERIGVPEAQGYSAGDLVELANLIAGGAQQAAKLTQPAGWESELIDNSKSPVHPIDCRGCEWPMTDEDGELESTEFCKTCTNGDKFSPLPIVQLYRKG